MTTNTEQHHTINAEGRTLGRVATEVASILIGKHTPASRKHTVVADTVVVTNVKAIEIRESKLKDKKYAHYSGYPGGLRFETAAKKEEKFGRGELLRRAVYGMLPSNRLRKERMKRLTIE